MFLYKEMNETKILNRTRKSSNENIIQRKFFFTLECMNEAGNFRKIIHELRDYVGDLSLLKTMSSVFV